jgi:hypothetical protein
MVIINRKYIKLICIFFSVLALVFLILPFLNKGFYASDDGEWMIIRFAGFYSELAKGQFPVRIIQNLYHGYGYPVPTFLYPGFMYVAALFKLLGLGFINSVKTVMILSLCVGSTGIYAWLKQRFKTEYALAGMLLFAYSPYILFDMFSRGSVGELLAIGILPWILWAIDKRVLVLVSILLGILILSHNTLALLFVPFIFFYGVFVSEDKRILSNSRFISVSILFGLGLSFFFWFPALSELKYTMFKSITVSKPDEYFISFSKYPFLWIYYISISVYFLLIYFIKNHKKQPLSFRVMFVTFFLGVFLAFPLSNLVWKVMPLPSLIQFPFRFLVLTIVPISFICIYAVKFSPKNRLIKILLILLLLFQIGYAILIIRNISYIQKEDAYYATNDDTTTVRNEYLPVWVYEQKTVRAEKAYERIDSNYVQINKVFWPGYTIFVNDIVVPIRFDNPSGLMVVPSKADSDTIKVVFKETRLQKICNLISLISFVGLIFYYLYAKKTKKI